MEMFRIYIGYIYGKQIILVFIYFINAIQKLRIVNKVTYLYLSIYRSIYLSMYIYIYIFNILPYRRGAMVIITAQLHSTKPELSFCARSNPACGMSEIHDVEDL